MPAPGLTEMATTTQRKRSAPLRVEKVKIKATLKPAKGAGTQPHQAAKQVAKVVRTLTGYKRNP